MASILILGISFSSLAEEKEMSEMRKAQLNQEYFDIHHAVIYLNLFSKGKCVNAKELADKALRSIRFSTKSPFQEHYNKIKRILRGQRIFTGEMNSIDQDVRDIQKKLNLKHDPKWEFFAKGKCTRK
jgi:hypothetical protein